MVKNIKQTNYDQNTNSNNSLAEKESFKDTADDEKQITSEQNTHFQAQSSNQTTNELINKNDSKLKKISKFAHIKPDDIVIIGHKSSLYSTAYTLHKVELFTEGAIRFFRKKTFSRINNCLFNLCMILPIHMNDEEYKEVFQKLTNLFNQTEQQITEGYSRLQEIVKNEISSTLEIKYSAPLSIELKLRTPLAERYLNLLKLLDQMLITIDQALTIGIIQNPKDAVKLKYRWEQNIYQFSGEIRNLDIQNDKKTKEKISQAKKEYDE